MTAAVKATKGTPPKPNAAQAKPAPPDSASAGRSSTTRGGGTPGRSGGKRPATRTAGRVFSKFPAGKIYTAEFIVAVGINSWQALKQGQVPFPGTICRTAAAFGILTLVYYLDDDIAALLGAGFIMALIMKQAGGGYEVFGALAPDDGFFYLTFKGGPAE